MFTEFADGRYVAEGQNSLDSNTAGTQQAPTFARLASGGFVATWVDNRAAVGRLFDASGERIGSEFLVAIFSQDPHVVGLTGGGFVIGWTATDASGTGVKAQIFSSTGLATGGVIDLPASAIGNQGVVALTALATGGFAAAWQEFDAASINAGIEARVFNAAGVAVTGDISVAAPAGNSSPTIAALADGNFAVAYSGGTSLAGSASSNINARVYDLAGNPTGTTFTTNGITTYAQAAYPRLAVLSSGEIVLAWVGYQSGSAGELFAQKFTATGAAVGGALSVSTSVYGHIAITATDAGFAVAFGKAIGTDPFNPSAIQMDIAVQLFDASGMRLGSNFIVNAPNQSDQSRPSIVQFGSGDLAIAFTNYGTDSNGDASFRLLFNQIVGTSGDDVLSGGPGADIINGREGNDLIAGNAGDDTLIGGGGVDTIEGGEGLDLLYGDDGNDSLSGGAGDDYLSGGNGDDALYGGTGDDNLAGGAGNDLLDGGEADEAGDFADYNAPGAGAITVNLAISGPQFISWTAGTDRLVNIENVTGSYFDDQITGNAGPNRLFGLLGSDVLTGAGGIDYLDGGDHDDIYIIAAAADHTAAEINDSGTGIFNADQLRFTTTIAETLKLYAGDTGLEYVFIGIGTGPGFDTSGTVAANIDASLVANGLGITGNDGNNILTGTAFSDFLGGNAGIDTLNGGDGDDFLSGGTGADHLTGGAGSDKFHDTAANFDGDTITDFTAEDRIVISDANISSFNVSLSGNTLTFTGGSLTLSSLPMGRFAARATTGDGVELFIVTHDARNDFNGDGLSDLALRNSDGEFRTFPDSASAPNALDTSWRIVGTGDFNGDGRDDILWRHSSGEIGEWLGQWNRAFTNNGGAAANAVDNSWSVAGVADFNGDGRDDILWRHSSGEVGQWLGQPSGGFANNGGAAANKVDSSWIVVASGDFNGDGRADVLWRHTSGAFAEWQGTSTGALVNAGPVLAGASGSVVGSGDFNGDGRDDVLMRAANGAITAWLGQSSGQFTSFTPTRQLLDSNWKIVAIGDYNGDGSDDLIWRHASGEAGQWLATGSGDFTYNGAIPTVDPSWQIQSPDILLA